MRVVTTRALFRESEVPTMEHRARITAPHFTADLVVRGGDVFEAPAVVQWTVGKRWLSVFDHCLRKGWHIQVQPPEFMVDAGAPPTR